METAIFLYSPGKQKEVVADKFISKKRYSRGTFICSECGGDVVLRKSDKQKNYFAHFMKSELSRECDRRVDGKTNLTIYQRLGVPLYLIKSKINGFELNIGLKSISRKEIELSEKAAAYIELKIRKNKKRRINIDRFNFSPERLNLFKIDNYPNFGERFLIQYSNLPSSFNKWADFIDPIIGGGILFSINSNVGKSVRHGDTIYSDEEYLWLSHKKLRGNSPLERNVEYIDEIRLNNQPHYIYQVQFVKNQKDYKNFNIISESLYKILGVVLLDSKNEINLIWPPGIKTAEGYSVSTKGRVHSVVQSVNKEPNIYMYSDDGYTRPTSEKMTHYKGVNYLHFNLSDTEVQLNMDRQITSTGINLRYEKLNYEGKEIKLIENESNSLDLYASNDSKNLDISLKANMKLSSIKIDSNKRIEIKKSVGKSMRWMDLQYGDVIYLINSSNIISKINLTKSEELVKSSLNELLRISKIPQRKISLTYEIRRLIYNIIDSDKRYNVFFQKFLRTNNIPIRIYYLLLEVYKHG